MIMEHISISIIIPVFNVAPFVEACLNSVMRQTYAGSMECIIVDDCGTDNSIAIIEMLISEYNGPIRFQIIHHDHNRGLSAARNTGTLQATGDYLYYLDSDDEITDDCLEILMAKVKEYPDVEMVQGNYCCHPISQESVIIINKLICPLVETNAEVRKSYYQYGQMDITVWNKLIRRDFVMNNSLFCKEGILFEDQLWTFYLLKHLKKVAFEKKVTYHQKKRPFSITTGTDDKTRFFNYNIVYSDMLSHLTAGFEEEELEYITMCIGGMFVRYGYKSPICKDVYRLLGNMNRIYGNRGNRLLLGITPILGQFKYGSLLWRIMLQLEHPSRIPYTIRRLYNRRFSQKGRKSILTRPKLLRVHNSFSSKTFLKIDFAQAFYRSMSL